MARTIERVIYVDDCNDKGEGVCKIMFMLDRMDIKCCCHGRHLGNSGASDEFRFPASAEVNADDRKGITGMMVEYTGKKSRADWTEFTIQVDECVDDIIENGWCLPCTE